jgi:proteic killer suppression protein
MAAVFPNGNNLRRRSRFSIRVNNQWRIWFTWKDGDACDVAIVDYH